jgi:hypothetical protein
MSVRSYSAYPSTTLLEKHEGEIPQPAKTNTVLIGHIVNHIQLSIMMTPRGFVGDYQHFRGTYHLHLQHKSPSPPPQANSKIIGGLFQNVSTCSLWHLTSFSSSSIISIFSGQWALAVCNELGTLHYPTIQYCNAVAIKSNGLFLKIDKPIKHFYPQSRQ